MDLAGKTLGQYQILEQLGQGGMASVFKAHQPSLNRFVAVKVLPAQLALTSGFSERFVREAQTVAQLNHPNILPVIDFGQDQGLSYIAMKYVAGGTLRERLGQPMELERVIHFIEQVAAALDHAHSRGILHRDIKPSNVLLDEGDWVQLADFGLAKLIASDEKLTGSGLGVGTPAYMAPEQSQGSSVDHRADIYSLGVVVYEMTTGQLPFEAETPMAVVIKHVTESPPPPCQNNPTLPQALDDIILKALHKTPSQRYASAGALARALKETIASQARVVPIYPKREPVLISPDAPVAQEIVSRGTLERKQIVRWRQILITRFDEGELRILCFNLGIDYASLPGESKADKTRELIAYLERHARIPELVEVGRQLRPDISWIQIIPDAPAQDVPSPLTPQLVLTPPPEPTRPPQLLEFVGREAELDYFEEKLKSSHLAVVTGMAGVGKTSLAVMLSRRVADLNRTFWHAFHKGEGVDALLWKLAGFLAWQGQEDLWRMLQSAQQTGGQPPPTEVHPPSLFGKIKA